MAQENKTCAICGVKGHSKFYCKNKMPKPIKQSAKVVKKVKKPKKVTRSQLVKKLDKVFSEYIRRSNSIGGMATCVTCGDTKEWKYQQNGHYMSRGHYPTRWDETNCHVQCPACNVFKKGNYTEYALYMINRYGADYMVELSEKAKSGEKYSTPYLRELLEEYQKKLAELA